jgi:hypothetical protein
MVRKFVHWLKTCTVSCPIQDFLLSSSVSVYKLVYLPPYSPDYNPIEQAFSTIKAYLRCHSNDLSMMGIIHACQSITPEKAAGYFRASGYIV